MRFPGTLGRLPLLLLLASEATAASVGAASRIERRQGSEDLTDVLATVDDSCNVGFCSVMGA
jgi:hypothetical protein